MLMQGAARGGAMPTIVYSRGRGVRDVNPQQIEVRDFDALVNALETEDRTSVKLRAAYFCAAMGGNGRRLSVNALPRSWLAIDIDRVDANSADRVLEWLASRGRGAYWYTHSSTPHAPHLRFILQLSRNATRAECITVCSRMAASLVADLGSEVVEVDKSTFFSEQPIFMPPPGATIERFGVEPIEVAASLAADAGQKSAEVFGSSSSVSLCSPLSSSVVPLSSSVRPASPGVVDLVHAAIAATLPDGPGKRQRCLFEFTRRMKTLAPDATRAELRGLVKQWHAAALPTIATTDFAETWDDFERGWTSVRVPHGAVLTAATIDAIEFVIPAGIAALGYGPLATELTKLCGTLAERAAPSEFFISCRIAADQLGVDHRVAAKLLSALVRDGVLELVSKGAGHRASRYRWAWADASTPESTTQSAPADRSA